MSAQHGRADHTEHVDLLVIGWGKGGKTLAGTAARHGRRVALVEQSDQMIGGTCINVACVPTKILVHEADQRREGDDPEQYFAAAVERRSTLTSAMRTKNFQLLDDLDSVLLVAGHAEFTGEREVLVTGGDDTLHLRADTVVINTGCGTRIPMWPRRPRASLPATAFRSPRVRRSPRSPTGRNRPR